MRTEKLKQTPRKKNIITITNLYNSQPQSQYSYRNFFFEKMLKMFKILKGTSKVSSKSYKNDPQTHPGPKQTPNNNSKTPTIIPKPQQ